MPKLPQQNKTSVLEVLDKKTYSTGEITFPKVSKHHRIFKHHLKLSIVLFAVVVVLGLVFVAGKGLMKEEVVEDPVVIQPDYSEASFKQYTEEDYANLKIENSIMFVAEKVDVESSVIEGYEFGNTDSRHVVKFGEQANIYWVTAPNVDGVGGGEQKKLDFDKIIPGSVLRIITFEDPKKSLKLTVVNAESII